MAYSRLYDSNIALELPVYQPDDIWQVTFKKAPSFYAGNNFYWRHALLYVRFRRFLLFDSSHAQGATQKTYYHDRQWHLAGVLWARNPPSTIIAHRGAFHPPKTNRRLNIHRKGIQAAPTAYTSFKIPTPRLRVSSKGIIFTPQAERHNKHFRCYFFLEYFTFAL